MLSSVSKSCPSWLVVEWKLSSDATLSIDVTDILRTSSAISSGVVLHISVSGGNSLTE